MTDTALYAELSELLREGGASELIKRMHSHYVSWDEFLAMRLPSRMSPEATWDLLKLVNRAAGIEIPIPDLAGNDYWYLRTHEVADAMARIQCLCRADSGLYLSLTATHNRRVLVRSRIDETIAAALLDGLEISEKAGLSLLQHERTPRTDTERLVTNTLSALDHLDELVNERFSEELFLHLRDLVLEGVNVERIKMRNPRLGLHPWDYADTEVSEHAHQQLQYISDYVNHTSGDVYDNAVFRALLLPDLFRFYRPLPNVNSQVGRLAFRLYAMKIGLPVLGLLPLSRSKLDWEDGKLGSSLVSLTPASYAAGREHDGVDLTAYATLALQLSLSALQDLHWELHRLKERDDELRTLLQRDPEINHRQRSVLGRALRNPTAEFRISYHKTTHNIVYATARADLLELADKGFLEVGKSGRAMVFTPRPGLREYIEHGYGAK